MIILIALVTGITNIQALICMFGVNSAMILFGLVHEQVNVGYLDSKRPRKVNWWPFIFGCIAGVIPWIALALQLGEAQTLCLVSFRFFLNVHFLIISSHLHQNNRGIGSTSTVFLTTTAAGATTAPAGSFSCIPAFVFGVFASLLFCFNTFGLNMWLQYAKIWKWKDPYFAEMVYLWLSLVAKALLTWQVYAGAGAA